MNQNKVAIVTGASKGIGRAIAIALAEKGCSVVLAARNKKRLEAVRNEIGEKALVVKADIRSSKGVSNLIKKAKRKFGRIDVLVNNAGIRGDIKPLFSYSEKTWDDVIATNLKGTFLCCKAVLPIMMKQKSGMIINISSVNGLHSVQNLSAYSASKFGIIGLTESLAYEVQNYGIKIYAVCPAGVDTEMHRNLYPGHNTENLLKPEDVAKKVVKLCSGKAASGSIFVVRKRRLCF